MGIPDEEAVFSLAVSNIASSWIRGCNEVSVRKYLASSRPRCATSGALINTEAGPVVGTSPRFCTNVSNAARCSRGMLSLLTSDNRAAIYSYCSKMLIDRPQR